MAGTAVTRTAVASGPKRVSPWAPVGLGLLTLGIYNFYWHYRVNREMRDLGENVNPWLSLAAVTVGLFAFVPFFVSVHRTAKRVRRYQESRGVPQTISPWLMVFLSAGWLHQLVAQPMMQHALNQAATWTINRGESDGAVHEG